MDLYPDFQCQISDIQQFASVDLLNMHVYKAAARVDAMSSFIYSDPLKVMKFDRQGRLHLFLFKSSSKCYFCRFVLFISMIFWSIAMHDRHARSNENFDCNSTREI